MTSTYHFWRPPCIEPPPEEIPFVAEPWVGPGSAAAWPGWSWPRPCPNMPSSRTTPPPERCRVFSGQVVAGRKVIWMVRGYDMGFKCWMVINGWWFGWFSWDSPKGDLDESGTWRISKDGVYLKITGLMVNGKHKPRVITEGPPVIRWSLDPAKSAN